jgi:DNA-directed RNA polymerase specialized sigma24 family protein
MTLVEVADLEGVSKDTVRRAQIAAVAKMRTCLEDKGWQLTDIMELQVEGMPFDPKTEP